MGRGERKMKMIPISEIDLLIKELKDSFDGNDAVIQRKIYFGVQALEKIKQKAIPAVTIEKIDFAIEQIRNTSYKGAAVKILEDLKR
jgi:hypothetical protein